MRRSGLWGQGRAECAGEVGSPGAGRGFPGRLPALLPSGGPDTGVLAVSPPGRIVTAAVRGRGGQGSPPDIECGGHPGGGDGTLLAQSQVRLATGDHRDLAWCRAAAGSVKGSGALLTPWQLLIRRPLPSTCTSCGCGSQDETGSAPGVASGCKFLRAQERLAPLGSLLGEALWRRTSRGHGCFHAGLEHVRVWGCCPRGVAAACKAPGGRRPAGISWRRKRARRGTSAPAQQGSPTQFPASSLRPLLHGAQGM
ncbi:transcription elongation factor A protein 2 isoform X5 [Trachypithecus francoisi]|uniref:transcription elongation factor A protein 2 isoform X5 n=1 Tax=Trachypithecus francoisi TaxID=54180 RepID=UPI00141BA3D9|nr:transcription elongation factor A protein 2 isoform X5 [Trachypithecus francoisi]